MQLQALRANRGYSPQRKQREKIVLHILFASVAEEQILSVDRQSLLFNVSCMIELKLFTAASVKEVDIEFTIF